MLLCPRSLLTSSNPTPAVNSSHAKVSRIRCASMCPSRGMRAASKHGTMNRFPQLLQMDFLDPMPDQKKYAGLSLGIPSSPSATEGQGRILASMEATPARSVSEYSTREKSSLLDARYSRKRLFMSSYIF